MESKTPDVVATSSVPIGVPSVAKRFWHAILFLWFAAVALIGCLLPPKGGALASHVQNVSDYALALREGQRPPLVAPTLEGGLRVPLFQYYSGTAYVIPGLLARRGVEAGAALNIAVFVHALAAGTFVYLACRVFGLGAVASIVAGTAYQVVAFAAFHRIRPGDYTDFAVWTVTPLVFYCGLRLVRARGRWDRRRWLWLMALALAYFVPLHPIQVLFWAGAVFALLLASAVFDARTRRAGPGRLLAALACGAAASAWFWWPLVRDRNAIAARFAAPNAGNFVPNGADSARAGLIRPDGRIDTSVLNLIRVPDRRRVRYVAEVAPGKEGLYQLPVCFLPSNDVHANGKRVKAPPVPGAPVANGAMTVVPLPAGTNFIKIRTRPTLAAWRVSVIACVLLGAGALNAAIRGRPRQSVSVRHL